MTSKRVVRLNDPSDHGGYIITASGKVRAEGIHVALEGDLHVCPIEHHGTTPVHATTHRFKVTHLPVLRDGDIAECGAVISATTRRIKVGD